MSKVKIKLAFLGHIPHSIDTNKIKKWKSDLFEISGQISSYNIVGDSDGQHWEYSDAVISRQLPDRDGADVLIAVTNVPLQYNYYVRGFTDNKACMTYQTMAEILRFDNIPLENLIMKILYFISFAYKYYGNQTPQSTDRIDIIHDEAKGCIFDFNGYKTDVIYSLNKPCICPSCVEKLTSNQQHRIERNLVDKVQQELKGIKKGLYFQLADFVKRRPILAIIISSAFALALGIIGSTLSTILWEKVLKHWL